ncbi:MCP four helix bundle domain-containing protein [Burkholderia plantarii]|uniref:ATP-binding protein n=1 Tax=Burkholderia plantarii TaxID=41899 RepID=UPI00272BCF8F|nr:ATP-binding protein [Burkholderia plantarii]WLE60438.1 MCP four helix bundle domain-containing protein [Burkholderia plantarii]
MTIRHRITLLVALMFVALAAIGGYAVYQAQRSAASVRQVTQGVVPSALASSDLVADLKDVQIAMMTLVYAPDANMASQALTELNTKEASLRAALDVQSRSATGQAQTGLISQARDSLTNYFDAIHDTAKMKSEGKNELAQAYLFANVAQYRDELEGIIETLRIEKNRQKDEAIATLNGMLATTTMTIAIVAGIVIVVLIGVGLMLYRQIVRPLGRMQEMMSEIASSQDFTRRVPVGRMDEIGRSIVAFNGMIETIQRNAAQLKQRTADIQAMLQNMQQGILTIVPGGTVHREYSAFLERIFETGDIAGRPAMELVFADSDVGSDGLAQIEAAIDACLGEDGINFEFNQHLLVNEIGKRMPNDAEKRLDLSWSAITDETGTIVRLMLCVRDVTELRALSAQANEQRRRLEMIGEILAVSQDKFHDFVESATGFLHENERIIRQHERADSSALAELFRNMHTIKGNARTYSLQHLTNIVHEAEQVYDELRSADAAREWDQHELMSDLARVREALDHYATINNVSLNRRGPATGAEPDRYLVVERARIHESLRLLDSADPSDPHNWLTMRDSVRDTLRLLGTETLGGMIAGVTESLPALAADLGKAAPVVRIDDNGYRVRSEAATVIKDVFMHLLRNALDHGIEAPEARRASGKADEGTIDIEVGVDAGMLQITVSDDGRGLALARIRSIAGERGWLDDAALANDDHAVAALIFRPGFSTASAVTDVSGRGVGMDAVRSFVVRAGGSISLRFTDDRQGAAFRRFQTIVSLPDNYAVDSVGIEVANADEAARDDQAIDRA